MLKVLVRAVQQPVITVLAIAGVADIVTGDPAAHGIALMAVAGVLLADVSGLLTPEGVGTVRDRWRFEMTPRIIVAGVAYAVTTAVFARFSWPLTVAVVAPAVLALSFVWRGTTQVVSEPGPPERTGGLAWAAVFLAAAMWEVQALLQQPTLTTSSWAHPTLSTLMDPVLATYPGRAVSLTVWLLIGGYLLER